MELLGLIVSKLKSTRFNVRFLVYSFRSIAVHALSIRYSCHWEHIVIRINNVLPLNHTIIQ